MMPQVCCVDLPALPLQLILRAHPEWANDAVVVVQDDRPQSPILWANRRAREHKIRRGTTIAAAKALSSKLHAEVVPEHAIEAAVDEVFDLLIAFSPAVEPAVDQPGLYWVDPRGLRGLFGDCENWAARLHARLAAERYTSAVVVGFQRAGVYAIARLQSVPLVLSDAESERSMAARVPLGRLSIPPRLRDDMALLGVSTVGEFLALPVAQLRVRYGPEAAQLHDFLSGRSWTPLLPRIPREALRFELAVEPPDDDLTRLLFGLKNALHRTLVPLIVEHEAVTALEIAFVLEREQPRRERIETAAPTLDVLQILELVRLRMGGIVLPARVELITAVVEHTRVHPRQFELWSEGQKAGKQRDLEAAARALARLRASFGPESVTRARLREAHLPEASFAFERATEVSRPSPPAVEAMPLVRRVYAVPVGLPPLPNHEPEAWLGRYGAVEAMFGPDRISGGWWTRARERDYYFIETQQGQILWVFYDRPGRRWFLHGLVD